MKNFKFTGVNIAAAILILAYFMPWVSANGQEGSGFKMLTTGISPGMAAMFIDGMSRIGMILTILVPACGGIILKQSLAPVNSLQKYLRIAHFIPVLFLIAGIGLVQYKISAAFEKIYSSMGQFSSFMPKVAAPGMFDVLGLGFYLSIIAGIYLLLVAIGKVQDKEYFSANNTSLPRDPNSPSDHQ
jgi:hypothetical protein